MPAFSSLLPWQTNKSYQDSKYSKPVGLAPRTRSYHSTDSEVYTLILCHNVVVVQLSYDYNHVNLFINCSFLNSFLYKRFSEKGNGICHSRVDQGLRINKMKLKLEDKCVSFYKLTNSQ